VIKFIVDQEHEKLRLDIYLAQKIDELSRSSIQKLIEEQKVSVNGKNQDSNYKVRLDDNIKVSFDLKALEKIPKIELPVIYEDSDCLVIDKPAGVLTHSKGNFNREATVASFIKPKLKDLEGNRAGIVHRLDRGTSGVIIIAKTPQALNWLQKQFSSRKVKKIYLAIIEGQLQPPEAIIDMPIERHPANPKTFRVDENGKSAITEYKTIKSKDDLTLLELKPKTGRTHQLRVHLKQLGHPILGDTLYGGKPADRLYLHASSLEIALPNKQRRLFESSPPKQFIELVA